MTTLKFVDQEGVDNAIRSVRNDNDETSWVVFGYKDNNAGSGTIVVESSGSGGVQELVGNLQPDHISYAILRVTDFIDGHATVKFVFIHWVGPNVKYMQKAKSSTHMSSVSSFIGQYHVTIAAESTDEINEEIVMGKVQDASGSGNRTLDADNNRPNYSRVGSSSASSAPPPASTFTPSPSSSSTTTSAPKTSSPARAARSPSAPASSNSPAKKKNDGVEVPEDRSAIDEVRSDATRNADWALYSYEGQANKVVYVTQGLGGIEELKQHLTSDNIYYGFLRVQDEIDGRPQTKFVYVIYIGSDVRPTRKALIATHKGAVNAFIGQHHVDITVTDPSELTEDAIMTKVMHASGSASHVRDGVEASSGRLHLH